MCRLASMNPEDMSYALAYLAEYSPGAFDAILDAIGPTGRLPFRTASLATGDETIAQSGHLPANPVPSRMAKREGTSMHGDRSAHCRHCGHRPGRPRHASRRPDKRNHHPALPPARTPAHIRQNRSRTPDQWAAYLREPSAA